MLQVFYGTDRTAVRDATQKASEAIGVAPTIVDYAAFVPGAVASSTGAASLFGGSEVFILDTPSDSDEFETEVLGNLADMAASANVFIILESVILADAKKKYGKHAAKVEEFNAVKAERFNSFALAEALAKKDKKKTNPYLSITNWFEQGNMVDILRDANHKEYKK